MNPNRVRAKGWFLTYPQCPIEKEDALEQLKQLSPANQIVEYVVAREKHQDEEFHLHAFLKYAKRVEWTPTRWDIGNYHGNYQVAKSWKAVSSYCKKDGDYISSIADSVLIDNKHALKNKQLMEISEKEAVDNGLIPLIHLPNLIKAKAAYRLLEEAKD